MQYELPPRPEGELPEQITRLWEAMFRLIEQLNTEREQSRRNGGA